MINTVNIDLTNTSCWGVCNAAGSDNEINLHIKLLESLLDKTDIHLEFTKPDGTIIETTNLDITNDQLFYEIPFNLYVTKGTLKLRILATNYTSDYIIFNVLTDYTETDDICVKCSSTKEFNINKCMTTEESDKVKVSPTKPIDNDIDIWIQKGNNIFKDSLIYGLGNLEYENGTATQKTADTNQNPNWKLQAYNDWNYVATLKTFYPVIGKNSCTFVKKSNFNVLQLAVNGSTIDTAIYIDISNLTNDETYTISFNVLNTMQGSISWNEIQIEKGSKATNYMPYVEKKIYCKNDNGDYEEFINVETMEIKTVTNEKGTAIKFPDGTLIQKGYVYCGDNGAGVIKYPIPFIDTNNSMTANNRYNGSSELGIIITTQCDNTTGGAIYFRKYVNGVLTMVTDTSIIANWIAIGKWK